MLNKLGRKVEGLNWAGLEVNTLGCLVSGTTDTVTGRGVVVVLVVVVEVVGGGVVVVEVVVGMVVVVVGTAWVVVLTAGTAGRLTAFCPLLGKEEICLKPWGAKLLLDWLCLLLSNC